MKQIIATLPKSYCLVFVLSMVFIIISCESATNSSKEATVEALQSDPVFISFADAYVSYVEPTLMKTWSSEFLLELEQKAKTLKEGESMDHQVYEEVLQSMGYSNMSDFEELQSNLVESIKNMENRFPDLNFSRPDNRKNQMVISELEKYIDINHPNLFRITHSFGDNVRYKCKDDAGLKECLSDKRRGFLYRTALCGVASLGNPLGGAGCQAVNILWHEAEKRDCVDDNC